MALRSDSFSTHSYHSGLAVVLGCLFLFGCSAKPDPERRADKGRPRREVNVVLITIDTLRADHLSCYARDAVSTPNIDALAAAGGRFAKAFAQVPLTTPSHASILTGTYPQVHQLRDNGGFVLDSTLPTLASVMRQAGFTTAAFVGAAVLHHQYGLNRGFDTYADDMRATSKEKLLPGVVAEVRAEVV